MICDAGINERDGVFKLGVGEVDNGLFELRGGNFNGLSVERIDGRGSRSGGEVLPVFEGFQAEGKGLKC